MKSQSLSLYSEPAKRLMHGRVANRQAGQYAIHGLFQFAAKAKVVWQDTERGNPFAWWYLGRFEERLQDATLAIKMQRLQLNQRSNDQTGFDYQPDFEVMTAQTFEVAFITVHAWQAVRLVKQFDHIVLHGECLLKVGLMKRADYYKMRQRLNGLLVAVFQEASLYTSLDGITVENVRSLSDEQKRAAKVMGKKVPKRVIKAGAEPWFGASDHG